MAEHQLILPKMGESVSEATIIKWLKQPGDRIEEDEPVLEIATEKVDSDVPSPVSGVLKEHLFAEDAVVQVGQVLALISTGAEETNAEETNTVESPIAVPYVPDEEPVKSESAHVVTANTVSESTTKP